MARIAVRGKPQKFSVSLVREAMGFFCDTLMGARLSKNVFIRINFLRGFEARQRSMADVIYMDDEARSHREFDIRIDDNLGQISTLRTLAHETVHIKQYARNQLRDSTGFSKRWMKVIYESDTPYHACPWEVEARSLEKVLFKEWILHRKGQNGFRQDHRAKNASD